MFTIIGILVVLGGVAGGYLMEGGHPVVLNQPAEFLIIGGAAVISGIIQETFVTLRRAWDGNRG